MCSKCVCPRKKLETASTFKKLSNISLYIKEDRLTRGNKLGMFIEYLREGLKGDTPESAGAIQFILDYKSFLEVKRPDDLSFYDDFYSLLRTMSENDIIRNRVYYYYKNVIGMKWSGKS